jgi:nicotinate-nucleotide adenylyltransferase
VGHLDVADAARRALGLDRVLLMPARVPPHRAAPRASAAHRFAMAALALAGRQGLALTDLEMQSTDPSYTSATLDRLGARGLDTRALFLITGADAFGEIATWKDYPALLDRAHFVVVSRPERSADSLKRLLAPLADRMIEPALGDEAFGRPRIVLVNAPTAAVSSTDIRRAIAAGTSISGTVPPLVEEYIHTNHLYREGTSDLYAQS